ncbi:Ring finger domain containing protein [Novymonas esmeraldas]|uniref:Ring finger domain containing protein n=1 Tax=Novymonas esmeraldas TaxID=1808958 RepID=A0AAW0F109_9TRYP
MASFARDLRSLEATSQLPPSTPQQLFTPSTVLLPATVGPGLTATVAASACPGAAAGLCLPMPQTPLCMATLSGLFSFPVSPLLGSNSALPGAGEGHAAVRAHRLCSCGSTASRPSLRPPLLSEPTALQEGGRGPYGVEAHAFPALGSVGDELGLHPLTSASSAATTRLSRSTPDSSLMVSHAMTTAPSTDGDDVSASPPPPPLTSTTTADATTSIRPVRCARRRLHTAPPAHGVTPLTEPPPAWGAAAADAARTPPSAYRDPGTGAAERGAARAGVGGRVHVPLCESAVVMMTSPVPLGCGAGMPSSPFGPAAASLPRSGPASDKRSGHRRSSSAADAAHNSNGNSGGRRLGRCGRTSTIAFVPIGVQQTSTAFTPGTSDCFPACPLVPPPDLSGVVGAPASALTPATPPLQILSPAEQRQLHPQQSQYRTISCAPAAAASITAILAAPEVSWHSLPSGRVATPPSAVDSHSQHFIVGCGSVPAPDTPVAYVCSSSSSTATPRAVSPRTLTTSPALSAASELQRASASRYTMWTPAGPTYRSMLLHGDGCNSGSSTAAASGVGSCGAFGLGVPLGSSQVHLHCTPVPLDDTESVCGICLEGRAAAGLVVSLDTTEKAGAPVGNGASAAVEDSDEAEQGAVRGGVKPGSCLLSLPCGHCYHQNCVQRWLMTSHICPTCRRDLSRDATQN